MTSSDGTRGSPDQGANAREQLVVGERASEDVVGAALERAHALDASRSRSRARSPARFDPTSARARHGEAAGTGRARRAARRPGRARLRELERLAAPRGTEDVEAVVAKLAAEVLSRLGLGLGDEDGTRHDGDASPASELRQMSFAADSRQAFLSRRSRHGPLQATVAEDAPDEPEAEHAGEEEADQREQVDARRRAARPRRRRR